MARPYLARVTALAFALVASLWTVAAGGSDASAPDWRFDSGEERVTLVELYSSEGCSSCPPAERWMGGLRDHPELWRRLVPINFHVIYWDRLGWSDRFASAEFTERQYRYVRQYRLGSAYTPGFFVNGREWRGFFDGDALPLGDGTRIGRLRLDAGDGRVRAEFVPAGAAPDELELSVAILGFDQKTDVEAGENRGRTLAQNFVVLGLATARARPEDARFYWQLELPLARSEWPADAALAGWVARPEDPTPLQAVGGMLERGDP